MQISSIILLAVGASAAPAFPSLSTSAASPASVEVVSEYFNLLARKVADSKTATPLACDLTKAVLPTVPSGLPAPNQGSTLVHVAIGRGTQNYTCDTANPSAAPASAGAVATLYNADCAAATQPELAAYLPRAALQFNLSSIPAKYLAPSNLLVSGHHFFTNLTTPFFTITDIGDAPCAKDAAVAAPADAAKGQQGEKAVPWLRLLTRPGTTGGLTQVYRVETAGGSAPATCAGMPASFQVQYSAQYWFYKG